ncbi:MAG: RNA polymerase sigma factor [Clostridia bacterium]|nr:RNA polymerase sigma factor [Clostridia bacterium]
MSELEELLQENIVPLQSYVKFKIRNKQDAKDIIQEVCFTATRKFDTLKNTKAFKAWLIAIANHKCNDYYRKRAKDLNISLDALTESELSTGRFGIIEQSVVRDTLNNLGDKEKQILYLYFFKDLSQEDIARKLSIPIGTVKSRLHYAKEKFKKHYPNKESLKGETIMRKIPGYLPEYKIEESKLTPFCVLHEELPGMFVVPRIGNSVSFGIFDMPSRKQSGIYELNVNEKIALHGIEGVSIKKTYTENDIIENTSIFAQLTDTHCRYLGGMHTDEDGVQRITTFLDPEFNNNYGIGVDNCGFPTHRKAEGKIKQTEDGLILSTENDISDIVGRFDIHFNGTSYDTVRLIDYQIYEGKGGMLCEHYIDKNGHAILWRRFNKNDWAYKRYGKLWTEMLPENETLIVNGEIYVHWYDCITDYIL